VIALAKIAKIEIVSNAEKKNVKLMVLNVHVIVKNVKKMIALCVKELREAEKLKT
jgi:hypothetical protein